MKKKHKTYQQQCSAPTQRVRCQPATFEGWLAVRVIRGSSARRDTGGTKSRGDCLEDQTRERRHKARGKMTPIEETKEADTGEPSAVIK